MQYLLYLLYFILSVMALLLLVAFIRAILIKKEHIDGTPYDMEKESIDANLHAQNLSKMLQVPCVSIRGSSDLTRIHEFHKILEELYPLIHSKLEKTDLDGALLFKWTGLHSEQKPILLMSHQDVVEASGVWKYPAFSGTIADGRIWGRGAVDTKGALCAILESVEHLLGEGFTPYCDVYIASSNNEEITGDGAIKTVEYLFEKNIFFDLVMDEGGNVVAGSHKDDASSAMIGIFEKGRANVKFIAHSNGGHASVPFKHNPFARLAKLINRIEENSPFKKKITKPIKQMYYAMAPYMKFKHRFLFGNIWLFNPFLTKYMAHKSGQMNAQISTTCIFTQAEGSHGANVIPETASVTANMRFMLHEGLEKSLRKVIKIARKYDIWMEMISGFDVPPVADMNTYAYRHVKKQIKHTFGDVPIIPYVMLAGTDARHYTKICNCVLRFVPLIMTDAQMKSAHAINENIYVSSLARGVNYYVDFLKTYGFDSHK